ncbi:GYF domain-containing protein [Mycena kentingensis (nom. inval.)]|nr:GYF domain-containing protein [Mycena kentingensis (nom. inval.)]
MSANTSALQFGPEWMRKPKTQPLATGITSASSYSSLVSPVPTTPADKKDDSQPFRYTREEMLKIYRDGGGKGALGLEVERHEGIVRESNSEPVGLKEMGDQEKKLFSNGLNSEIRRRPSIDTDRPRLAHNSSATGSPLRERFNMRRRESSDSLAPRRLSLSGTQAPQSPALPSPRTRFGHTPGFDGVLNGGESWVARRRLSEAKAANAARDPETHEARTTDIREEDEDPPKQSPPPAQEPAKQPEPPSQEVLAAVEWSYLDPQGQLQGPFRADLMQKWFDEGYFTPELLMKRTHTDPDWVAVKDLGQIALRLGVTRLFFTPFQPAAPPGISRTTNDTPGQPFAEPSAFNAPLQPAPVRTLRSSTLDAFSANSDSPSSSFGTGRFGNGSPDSNSAFGGPTSSQYSADSGARYGAHEASSGLRRAAFGDPPPANNARFASNDVYATNGLHQSPWPVSSVGNAYDAVGNAAFLAQTGYGHLRTGQDASFAHDASSPDYGFGHGQQYNPLHSSPYMPSQAPAPNLYGHGAQPVIPHQTAPQNNAAVATQSPWGAPLVDASPARRVASDGVRPVAQPNRPPSPVQASPWGTPAPAPVPAPVTQSNEPSPWFAASQGVIDDSSWKEDRGHSLTFSNLGQHNQQFAPPPEEAPKAIAALPTEAPPPPVEVEQSAKSAAASAAKSRTKSAQQPIVQPAAAATPPTPSTVDAGPAPPAGPPKTAWAKDDDSKRTKASGVSLSLRDIQDAEAKKAGARKVPEQRAQAPRGATSTAATPADDIPAFTGSWGLPTSQTGGRAAAAKDATPLVAPTVPTGTPAAAANNGPAAVWTNATKVTAAKKSMKEIQEEEEKRKKSAAKENAAAAAARRAYAETTTKSTPTPANAGGAWTTVGAPKVATPAAVAPARPTPTPAPSTTTSTAARVNGAAAPPRTAPTPAKTPAPRVEDFPATPSHDSVNVEEIMSMLLSFSLDPDASTVELISEMIYANSTTLDGRRFASDFVSKRKADALARPKGAAGQGGAGKPVSIADVVKAQPKPPASSEWGGFKVVNKKKKSGRS